jgi:hypothetical protein
VSEGVSESVQDLVDLPRRQTIQYNTVIHHCSVSE